MKLVQKKQDKPYNKVLYRQSDKHNLLKDFFAKVPTKKNKTSQSKKVAERNVIRVIVIDDKAYWVSENIFYVSDVVGEEPDPSTAKPVDTTNMSKKDVDKMMFILDNLNGGKQDDGSGAGK